MKRSMIASLFVVSLTVLGMLPGESSAFGLFRRGRGDCGDCGQPCAQPCAPAPVQYVEQKVTRYKPVFTEKEVVENVTRFVTKEEAFTYTVLVPKTYSEKRKVTVCEYKTETVVENVTVCRTVRVPCVDECGR